MATDSFDINVIMKKFSGQCKTAKGLDVEILKTDMRRSVYTIVGAVTDSNGVQEINTWTDKGQYRETSQGEQDLVMPTPRVDLYIVVNHKGIQVDSWPEPEAAIATCPAKWFVEHRVIENGVLTVEAIKGGTK